MVRDIFWDLDLARHGVTTGNGCIARVDWCIVNTTTSLAIRVSLKRLTGEPIVAMAWLISRAVRAITTLLTINVGTGKETFFEAIFSSLLLSFGRDVLWVEELVDDILILTYTIGIHASVITIVVHAPLYVNNLTGLVSDDRFFAPVGARLVIVHANSGVITARTCASDFGSVEVWPGSNGFQDGALGACIWTGLSLVS